MNQNREMRRHPTQAKQGRGGKPPAVRQTLTSGGGGLPGRGRAGGALRANWLRDIISELRKVQWPTREEAWHLTWVVVLVSVSVGIVLGGLDTGFGWFMEHTVLPH